MLRQRQVQNNNDTVSDANNTPRKRQSHSNPKKFSWLKLIFIFLFLLFGIFPLVFYNCNSLRKQLLFLNYVAWPPFLNLSDPEGFGFECVRNFWIKSESDIKLGTWHILPHSSRQKCAQGFPVLGTEFDDKRPVILYLHGNSGTRGGGHRVMLYKILAGKDINAHVIAFDYRGYGDSSNHVSPSVPGVVQDSKNVFYWLVKDKKVNPSNIVLWGHSLGTGVASSLIAELAKDNVNPGGLVLESPLSSTYEASYSYPVAMLHRAMPYFDMLMAKPLGEHIDTKFDNVDNMKHVKYPLLVLHAEDDLLLSYDQGKKIYDNAVKHNRAGVTKPIFKGYTHDLGYGHKYICNDPGLPQLVAQFLKSATEKS